MIPKLLLTYISLAFLGLTSANAGPCSLEIAELSKTLASKDAGSGPTPAAQPSNQHASNQSDQHPPNARMREQTEGKATSPEDVRRQDAGQPTAAQPGAADATSVTDRTVGASSALNRAQVLEREGREAERMDAIEREANLWASLSLAVFAASTPGVDFSFGLRSDHSLQPPAAARGVHCLPRFLTGISLAEPISGLPERPPAATLAAFVEPLVEHIGDAGLKWSSGLGRRFLR